MRRASSSLLFALIGFPLVAVVLASSMYLSSCSHTDAAIKRYPLRGRIIRLDPRTHAAVIDGQKIEGWMGAMTMEYPVKDLSEFQALHNGERIAATVFVRNLDFWIADIHRDEAQEK